jgi:hypothetical protein
MNQQVIDLKTSAMALMFAAVSFSNVESAMKVIAFIITVGYTARRWYILEQNKNKANED